MGLQLDFGAIATHFASAFALERAELVAALNE